MDGDDDHIDAVKGDHDRVNENYCRDLDDDQDDSERMFGQDMHLCIKQNLVLFDQ